MARRRPGWGGWGFVIRDNTGDAVGTGPGRIRHAVSAIQTGAEACLHALPAAAAWGISNIVVESDCQTLLHAIQGSEYDRSSKGVLFRDIRQFICLNFSTFAFSFAPRDCNKVAHALAALGSNGQEPQRLWLEAVPDDVSVLLASDVAAPV